MSRPRGCLRSSSSQRQAAAWLRHPRPPCHSQLALAAAGSNDRKAKEQSRKVREHRRAEGWMPLWWWRLRVLGWCLERRRLRLRIPHVCLPRQGLLIPRVYCLRVSRIPRKLSPDTFQLGSFRLGEWYISLGSSPWNYSVR